MKHKIITTILILSSMFLEGASSVSAAACTSVPISGNYTVSTSCNFSGTHDGVDTGSGTTNTAVLTIQSTKTLTVNLGQTVGYGSIVKPGGIIALASTAVLQKAPIWMTDQDVDNYAASTTQEVNISQPTNGRRRNLITSISTTDCYDLNANAFPGQTSYFTTNRGDGSFDYDCVGGATKQYTTNNTYSMSVCADIPNTGTEGWSGTNPDCGVSGTWRQCGNYSERGCSAGTFQNATVACQSTGGGTQSNKPSDATRTQACR